VINLNGGVLLFGLGELGNHILNFLVRTPRIKMVTTADINEERGICLTYQAMYGAFTEGLFPNVRFYKADLMNVEETAHLIRKVKPEVICSTAIIRAWFLRQPLSEEVQKKFEVEGFGGLAPIHSLNLLLPYKLMKAVKESGVETKVVITSLPDVTCPVLGKVKLTPTVGGGNFDLRVPWIRKIVSDDLKIPASNVSIYLVAHHAWGYHFGECPYWIKIICCGDDVTNKFPPEKLLPRLSDLHSRTYIHLGGPLGDSGMYYQQAIASSFVRNIRALYFDTGEIVHAPGPAGLPGGYPVRLSSVGAEIVLPEEISLKEAIKINEDGGIYDGIEQIEDDGTLRCTDGTFLKFCEIEDTAKKIMQILRKHESQNPHTD